MLLYRVYLKHSINYINNKYITLIVGTLDVLINVWQNNWILTPQILIAGLASGLASTGVWEAVKNTTGIN